MNAKFIQEMMEQTLLQIHTGFCGKVISVNGNMAAIQPLNMIKAIGGQPQQQAVIPNCPVLQSAKKFVQKQIKTSTGGDPTHSHTVTVWEAVGIAPGDTVYCVCADRDISETRTGNFSTPIPGHHNLANAVVVGIL